LNVPLRIIVVHAHDTVTDFELREFVAVHAARVASRRYSDKRAAKSRTPHGE